MLGVLALTQSPVFASSSVSNGRYSCTVTAMRATLIGTALTPNATISCTSAANVSVFVGLSEMDGRLEQVVQRPAAIAVGVARANTPFAIAGRTVSCLNTEAGNEEYATKIDVVLTTSTGAQVSSTWDLSSPGIDTFRC